MEALITKDMTIGDVVRKYPEAAEVFTSFGLHCVGCHVSPFETIEQGARGHGLDDAAINKMVGEANKLAQALGGQEPQKATPEKVELTITEAAASKVLDLIAKENKQGHVLRIQVVPGGCSGFSYQFLVEEKGAEGDHVFDQHGLKTVVDNNSMSMLSGCTIDYVETLNESGFKVENPNAQKSCGCGSSFS